MKRQIILGFFFIFLIFGVGSTAIINNLLRSTSSLQTLLNLHRIEDMRQNLNLRVQKVQSYVYLPALEFSYNLDEIIANIHGLETSTQSCLHCHHEQAVANDISYTQELIRDYEEKLSYIITSASNDNWRSDNQKQAIKLADTIISHVQEMVNRAASTLQRKTDVAMQQIKKTYLFLSITMICTVLMALLVGQYLTKKITTPIDRLLLATQKLTTGELGYTTDCLGTKEFVQLQKSFNAMSLALADKDQENQKLTLALQNKIDELSHTQQQLIISEKLASLGKLAGGIAHDFNNILCGMLGYISLLKVQFSGQEKAIDSLSTVEKAAIRASHLVKKLQSFAGHQEYAELPVNMNEVVLAVHQVLRAAFAQDYQLTLDLDQNLALVNGDYAGLQELLYNICENSIEALAGDGHGVMTIVTQNHHGPTPWGDPIAQPDKGYVKISITDNGQGIQEDNLQKIFDPYFSTRERSARRGMGLGMAIAFSIVKKHQGYIYIESVEGKGTQVDIYLPATPPSASALA